MNRDKFVKPEFDPDMNPVDFMNLHMTWDDVMGKFRRVTKIDKFDYTCPKDSREARKTADFSVNGDDRVRVNNENGLNLPVGKKYTKFQFFCRVKHKGNYKAAFSEIDHIYLNSKIPFIRVGCDYFKEIEKTDRYGIKGISLKGWKKDEIKQDHGKDSLLYVKTYDDFCIIPDNKIFTQVRGNTYNLYNQFRHKPGDGELKWSLHMMNHIFGEQVALGWRLMQLYYLHPQRYAPILVLVSKERETGKSTFINWLTMIFGHNCVQISASDLESSFNHIYATANIIAVEETFIDKKQMVEKLKALSTQKEIVVNQKFVSNYKIPFYGKFVLTSNNEDKFAIIDDEEVRFFVRKIKKYEITNHEIEKNLMEEIPAFLTYLEALPEIDFSVSRTGFTKEELDNDNLQNVVKESRSGLYKDLAILISEFIANKLEENAEGFHASATDIKKIFFNFNHNITPSYIAKVLRYEYNLDTVLESGKTMRYVDVHSEVFKTKVGNPFYFDRKKWHGDVLQDEKVLHPVLKTQSNDIQVFEIEKEPPF